MDLGIKALCHIAISCQSLEKSVAFYREIFGFEQNTTLVSTGGNVKLNIGNGTYIELFPFTMYGSQGRGCIAHFALNVDNLDQAVEFLNTKGLDILRGPFDVHAKDGGRLVSKVVFYAGPDGEEIELVEHID